MMLLSFFLALIVLPIFPDPALTPGHVFTNVTVEQLCTPGYTASVRHVSLHTRKIILAEYNLPYPVGQAYELDHRVPLEVGGDNSLLNLWPQGYTATWNAHQKDKLENYIHKLLCVGRLSLADARAIFFGNWTVTYQAYFGRAP